MTDIFTAEELAAMSAQVDEQLSQLPKKAITSGPVRGEQEEAEEKLLEKQRKEIEDYTKENADIFLQKFGNKAKEVLCKEGEELNKQWQRWGDLRNEDVLEKLGTILAVMGFAKASLQMLAVAITVYLLRIGLNVFCDKYCQ